MRIYRVLVQRIRSLFRHARAEAELQREMELHVNALTHEFMASGESEAEARLHARREFGAVEVLKEECRDMRQTNAVENLLRDLRYALRMIRVKPGFSVPALLSLSLGIGANIAIFSVVNTVLIRPLPYAEPEKLVSVFNSAVFPGLAVKEWPLTLNMYAAYRQNQRSFQDFGVWTAGSAAVTGAGDPEQVRTVAMTYGVLRALGVRPYLGRWFSVDDEVLGAQKITILSYQYWQTKFGGDPAVLGRSIILDAVPYQVVGIMPGSFAFPNLASDLFLAQSVARGATGADDADYSGLARLKPGISITQANQDITRVLNVWLAETSPGLKQLRIKPNIHPFQEDIVGNVAGILKILMGALAMVLLLVCANVANLVQVRAQARRAEFAIRAALGAGGRRMARQLMIESLALSFIGGATGLIFAYVGLRGLILYTAMDLPRAGEISIDSSSLLFALLCAVFSGGFFGFLTIFKLGLAHRVQNTRGATHSKDQLRGQNVLVVAQVAVALVLLVGTGLLVRSFLALSAVRPGFSRPEQIQTVRIFIAETQIREQDRVTQMQTDILHKLAAIPEVTAAGFATALPLQFEYHNGNPISIERKTPVDQIPPNRTIKQISPGLLAALGTPLVAGRDFTWDDLLSKRRVAIVSANMARENWAEPRAALGRRIRINGDDQWSSIVGVAENIYDDGVDKEPPGMVYFPGSRRGVTFAIRSNRAGSESLLKEIAANVHAVDPSLALAQSKTLRDIYSATMARRSFALVLLGIAAAMALTLSVIGVYGVLAYAVVQRGREISIRLAIGAEPATIRSLFFRRGLVLMSLGCAIGLLGARALAAWMVVLLFGVQPFDVLTYSVSGALILTASMAASYVPAKRAASLNPIEALRAD